MQPSAIPPRWEIETSGASSQRAADRPAAKPAATASPPSSGMLARWATDRSLGRSTTPRAVARRATGGVSSAATAPATIRGIRIPAASMGSIWGSPRPAPAAFGR